VHQTVTLNGQDSAYEPRLLLWHPGASLDTLVVENASYPELRHRRTLLFLHKHCFLCVDDVFGTAFGEVDAHFQLLPCEPMVSPETMTFHSAFATGANVLVKGMRQEGLLLEQEEGWVSYRYGTRTARPAFRFRMQKAPSTAHLRFVTLILPYAGPTPPAADVRIGDDRAADAARMLIDVRAGTLHELIGVPVPAITSSAAAVVPLRIKLPR